MFRHPSTEVIVVSLFNQTPDLPQTVTVSVLDWQNTCNPTEFNKFAFLCGAILNPPSNGNGIVINNGPGPFSPPVGFLPFTTSFTFTIPPRRNLMIHASPGDPVLPPSPLYEVVVNPLSPGDPILPGDPVRPPVLVNTWGIDIDGNIQEGNTVLHRQFVPAFSII
ncbi:sodium:proton exchanger [Aneurinibacillus migulanus]|uniref:sodium:proton exchanger n=1 Tax=Aneurinibacillus migulanus TaxID=47500 RepID=UPI00209D9E64|nr:sodium:proton exchanger [Aneurinibacillus migulanus]MCP1355497.1 sodium:proton exchanger [Aneurinibacillus migulanus]